MPDPFAIRAKLFLALMLVAAINCGRAGEEAVAPSATSEESAPAAARNAGEDRPVMQRRLVKRAELEIRVSDTRATAAKLESLAAQYGGYVASVSANRQDQMLLYSLTLRVPVERLDDALSAIRKLAAEIDRESVTAEDVTEQYIDLEARLRTLRATETELLEMLGSARESGQKLEDVMAVHGRLTEIRTTIEQIEGQRKALEQLSALSTISIELRPTEAGRRLVEQRWRPSESLRSSVRTLVAALQGLVNLAIWLVVVALPVGVLVTLAVWAVFRVLRTLRHRRAAPPNPSP